MRPTSSAASGRLKIRAGRRADSRDFLRLLVAQAKFEKLEPPTPAARRRMLKDVFERKRVNLLLAFDGRTPVGYALSFYAYSSFLSRPTLYLEDLFVLGEHRRTGVGKLLFLSCVREAKRRGCGRMEWSVLDWNKNAIGFYEKLGARRLSEWRVYRLDSRRLASLAGPR